ncbi:MAG TPA: tetratricopeptide repeat protein, partial [Candidatus Melainabacteria bacterium]|nr:tetratricopeptide repeat protein [Candidatus Melainabacteria bacterium]
EVAQKAVEKAANITGSIEELIAAGKYGHAIKIAHSAYDYAVQRFGPDSEEAINLLCQAAELYYMNKDFANAERYYLHVLEVRQEILKNADQKTNSVLRVLGKMCESTGNLHQAELYYSWALRISERIEDHYRVDEIHTKLEQLKSLKRSRESHKERTSP